MKNERRKLGGMESSKSKSGRSLHAWMRETNTRLSHAMCAMSEYDDLRLNKTDKKTMRTIHVSVTFTCLVSCALC